MASLKDVAKLAGVSISTVSRAINNSAPLDAETRRKVDAAILATKYRPNLLGKGLRSGSGYLIGLLVPEIVNNTFSYFIKYIDESVTARNYTMILGEEKNDPATEERFINMLIGRNVDGIIFSRVSDQSRAVKHMAEIPIVVFDRSLDGEDIPCVVLDNHLAGIMAGEYLLSLGHRQLGCVTGPMNIALARDRLKGFTEILAKNGVVLEKCNIYEGDFELSSGKLAAEFFLDKKDRPTAIWVQNDIMAIPMMSWLSRYGVRIPQDISVMGMDNNELCEMVVPLLTSVAQPIKEMCEAAVAMIIKQKEGTLRKKRIIFKPSIVVRESTSARVPHG
jgi:DNA-binding LacI/PurR family transcriptional regulator